MNPSPLTSLAHSLVIQALPVLQFPFWKTAASMWYNDFMSTDIPQTDGHSFYQFLGQRLENGAGELSPEEYVAEYRAYQDELKRFLEESQPAFDQAANGEGKVLDHEALMERVRAKLSAKSQ